MDKPTAREVLNAIKATLKLKTDIELARVIEIEYGAMTNWIARDSIQYTTLIPFLSKHNIDLNILADPSKQIIKVDIRKEPSALFFELETKYYSYKEYLGSRAIDKLNEDIYVLLNKYDNILKNLQEAVNR